MRKLLSTLSSVVLGLALASCSAPSPSTTLNVTMIDFAFEPREFVVPAGQQINLNTANNGAVVHNFVIMKFGTTAGNSWDDDDMPNIYWEVELQPGDSTSVTFTAPSEPGEYQVICRTPGHIEAGMIANLIVVAGE